MKVKCLYCGVKYTPTRRFVQKYCRTSCRVLAHRKRKTRSKAITAPLLSRVSFVKNIPGNASKPSQQSVNG